MGQDTSDRGILYTTQECTYMYYLHHSLRVFVNKAPSKISNVHFLVKKKRKEKKENTNRSYVTLFHGIDYIDKFQLQFCKIPSY